MLQLSSWNVVMKRSVEMSILMIGNWNHLILCLKYCTPICQGEGSDTMRW
jgi:hypothetical protein